MTAYVPYLYVNLIALYGFTFMLIAFLASRKTPEIWAFISMLVACILWTGGSILMRLSVYPGISFWYYVSIVALFTLPFLAYQFVSVFIKRKGYVSKIVIGLGTLIIDILTVSGLILEAPQKSILPNGGIVFTYSMDWPIAIVGVLAVLYILFVARILAQTVKEKGRNYPGIMYIIISAVVMIVGNMLQILPGNTFPFDTLAGIIFAILLMLALCQKHMFHLSLLISRSVIIILGLIFCAIGFSYFVQPTRLILVNYFGMESEAANTVVIILFALLITLLYRALTLIADLLFAHKNQQNNLVKRFSEDVSKTLKTSDIMDEMVDTIKSAVPVDNIYVLLPSAKGFESYYGSRKLASRQFSIAFDSPFIKYLKDRDSHYLVSDFEADPLYCSVWKDEKELFSSLSIACVYAIRNDTGIGGVLLLSDKQKNRKYTYLELDYVSTVASIASIAINNAVLYEKMYREARIDSLTDTYNYRFFAEQVEVEFEKNKNDCLALLYVDIDDFRLFNQLYGTLEGDHVLCTVAKIMKQCIGDSGTVYRYSGKIFAALLPHYDGQRTEKLAQAIRSKLQSYNEQPERRSMKPLSISCGICISPYTASSAKELIENADLAVFNAKSHGKDRINQFLGSDTEGFSIMDKVNHAIETVNGKNSSFRENNASVYALTAAIDAKDHYTYQHSQDVAIYAAALASAIGFNDEQIAMIYEAGLLHDIGKISIPESILSKTGALNGPEYEVMKGHVNNSIDIIRHLPDMEYLVPSVLGHHERWDGKGYPRGLKGEEIPQTARCLTLADSYDAMTTDRPYRSAMSHEAAAAVIEKEAGTQFDPKLASVFVQLIRSGQMDGAPGYRKPEQN